MVNTGRTKQAALTWASCYYDELTVECDDYISHVLESNSKGKLVSRYVCYNHLKNHQQYLDAVCGRTVATHEFKPGACNDRFASWWLNDNQCIHDGFIDTQADYFIYRQMNSDWKFSTPGVNAGMTVNEVRQAMGMPPVGISKDMLQDTPSFEAALNDQLNKAIQHNVDQYGNDVLSISAQDKMRLYMMQQMAQRVRKPGIKFY